MAGDDEANEDGGVFLSEVNEHGLHNTMAENTLCIKRGCCVGSGSDGQDVV